MEHVIGCACNGKKCSKCEDVLCVAKFTKDSGSKDGLKHKCRKCSNTDYAKWVYDVREYGLETRQYKKVDIATRFFSKVEKTGTCWLWHGSLRENGYGQFAVNRHPGYAHRWSYEYHKGPIPEGMQIDHLCRVRHCVNPDHLEAVTIQVNTLRGTSVSAMNAQKTHCVHGHLYTEENTIKTIGGRRCRICAQEQERKSYVGSPRILKTICPMCGINPKLETHGFCHACKREYDALYHRNQRHGISMVRQEKTHCKNGHPYNEENTYIHPTSGKHCRICRRERSSKYTRLMKTREIVPSRGYTMQEWRDLKAKYDYTCLSCGRREPDIILVADHVVPKSLGGSHDISNRQPLCKSCNSRKRDKIYDFRVK